jgi:chromosome segregation ATPase
MSDKTRWQQIKDKCTFDNGELIQVCFADEEITSLTEQLSLASSVIDAKSLNEALLERQLAASEHSLNKSQRELVQYKNMYASSDCELSACEYERNKYASEVMELEKKNAELVEEIADGQRRIKDLLIEIKEANTEGKWQERQGDDYGTY